MAVHWYWAALMACMTVAPVSPTNVVGYMPEWRHEGADFTRLSLHLTHLIFFSLEITPKGDITALDRLPRPELMEEARQAAATNNMKLLVCFGGNGRSGGFSVMTRNEKNRKRFITNLLDLMEKFGLDGVDYNWEYPGYRMGRGYLEEKEIYKDYEGLAKLMKETKEAFRGSGRVITMAYYPDTKQEHLIHLFKIAESADLLHSMSYDQGGPNHSPRDMAVRTISQARAADLPLAKLCLGLPFYGRTDRVEGDWVTYEDLVQQHSLSDNQDSVVKEGGVGVGFNGRSTIGWKVGRALEAGLGGVMVWEVGQDCRVHPVTRGDTVHVTTCPQGEQSSLLAQITATAAQWSKLSEQKREL